MFVAIVIATAARPAADRISSLPGWTAPLPSEQYSGYVNISDTISNKHVHCEATNTL